MMTDTDAGRGMVEAEKSVLAGRCGERNCPRCGKRFVCGAEAGAARCWCAELPPLPVDPSIAGCLCPACLAERSRAVAAAGR